MRLPRLYQMNAAMAANGRKSSIASKLPDPPSGETPKIRSIKSMTVSIEILADPAMRYGILYLITEMSTKDDKILLVK